MVPSHELSAFRLTLGAVQPSQVPAFLRQAQGLINLRQAGLTYEDGIIRRGLETNGPEDLQRAFQLFQRYGRLHYVFASRWGVSGGESGFAPRLEPQHPALPVQGGIDDAVAQLAWQRQQGVTATVHGQAALYDPPGAMAAGVIAFLDRQGLRAHYGVETPPPSFGILSREDPERLERCNAGEFKGLGSVRFDFPDDLQMAVVPKVYAELLRRTVGIQYVIPASDFLESHFTVGWARALPPDAIVVSAMKGLPAGKTPLQDFAEILEKAGRSSVPVVDVLGYLSSSQRVEEKRRVLQGKVAAKKWSIVLASTSFHAAMEVAKRWTGPNAKVSQEEYQGIRLHIVESDLLRVVILTDPDAIRANELASIYKNLEAIHLGQKLFEKMFETATDPGAKRRSPESLFHEFSGFYSQMMDQAEKDIRQVLPLEGIPEDKQVLLPEVIDDLYGSWGTQKFLEIYELVRRIFDPAAAPEDWQEAMVLLKLWIRKYFSVRNPPYGFCMAADRAAVMSGRWMTRQQLKETFDRLRRKTSLDAFKGEGEGDPYAKVREMLGLDEETEKKEADRPHYFFSMIPEGLSPEGLQIAEQLSTRYRGRKMGRLPASFREAHLLVQRGQSTVFFPPDVYRNIVDLSEQLAHVFPGTPSADRLAYVESLERLNDRFQTGFNILIAGNQIFNRKRDTERLLSRLVLQMRALIKRVRENDKLGSQEISLVNQAVIEMLTLANLFYILSPEEVETEATHLLRRMKRLSHFAKSGNMETLFPSQGSASDPNPELAGLMARLRQTILEEIGTGLIQLTYEMNVRFHSEDRAIEKKNISSSLQAMIETMEKATARLSGEPALGFFFQGMVESIRTILADLQPKKLTAHQRLLIYQALVDSLIHARRFLVFPEALAGTELQYTLKRFFKIRDFVQGKVETPLWHFGPSSQPPPALGSDPGG